MSVAYDNMVSYMLKNNQQNQCHETFLVNFFFVEWILILKNLSYFDLIFHMALHKD